jgi:hypothetical protein
MDGELARIAIDQHGIFFRDQALDCGYRDPEIATLVRRGDWVRLRRGAYATREAAEADGPTGLHVLTVRAATHQLSGLVVVTGASALAVLGVPVWGVPLDRAHVHREPGKSSRSEAGVSHHVGPLPDDQILEVDGLYVASPAWALVAAARAASFEAGVVMADGVRRIHRVDVAELKEVAECQRDWAGSVKANRVIDFSDPRAATVGESRGRVLIARLGLPAPDLQRRIEDADGGLIGISDFYFDEYRTAGEFDGRQKYGRALYEDSGRLDEVDLGEVVWREKRREDAFRDQGHEVVRFVWSELDGRDSQLRARFLRAFDRGVRRRTAL